MSPIVLVLFVLGMCALAYGLVFPPTAGANLTRLAIGDAGLTAIIFTVVGARLYDTGVQFDFGLFETGWVGATLLAQVVGEAVCLPFYLRRVGRS